MVKQRYASHKPNTPQTQTPIKGTGTPARNVTANDPTGIQLTERSVESQASVLRCLDPVQRQRVLLNIHDTQGNHHVQRLMAAWQSTPISATQGAIVQRSLLSTELQGLWDPNRKGAFFTRLRNLAEQQRQDADLRGFVGSQLQGDDRWLAQTILQHGPEPLWPASALEERHTRATQNRWAPERGRIAGTLDTTAGNRRVEAYYFPGVSAERALIIGGMHGSELSAVAVAEELVNTLRSDQAQRPYYTVIIVPRLFPDNVALAESTATAQPGSVNSPANIGRYTRRTPTRSVDPNRQFPAAGVGFDPADPRDARNRAIESENVMLLELIQRFQPTRVANLHSIRTPQSAGIYADPRTDAAGIACGFASDRDLALAMAARSEQLGVRVPGNRRSRSADVNAIYPRDPQAAPAGRQQQRSNNEGTSFGTWGTTAVNDVQHPQANRPAMTVITVEVAGAHRPSDLPEAQQTARRAEISGHATVLREIFLGQPGAGGRPAAPPQCPPQT